MALSMSGRDWRLPALGRYVVQRYCRLGLPYLAAMILVCLAYAYGREWLPEEITGSPVSLPQVLAHLFFLRACWAMSSCRRASGSSASTSSWPWCTPAACGCATVWAGAVSTCPCCWAGRRQPCPLPLQSGWGPGRLVAVFLPLLLHGHRHSPCRAPGPFTLQFWLYALLLLAAMGFEWRWRLLSALLVGLLLWHAEWRGWGARWPQHKAVLELGRISLQPVPGAFPGAGVCRCPVDPAGTLFAGAGGPGPVAVLCLQCAAGSAVPPLGQTAGGGPGAPPDPGLHFSGRLCACVEGGLIEFWRIQTWAGCLPIRQQHRNEKRPAPPGALAPGSLT